MTLSRPHAFRNFVLALTISFPSAIARAATPTPDALAVVKAAVQAELYATDNDHSRWRYRDEQKELNDSVSIVVQTDSGSVKRLVARGGKPLSPDEARQEEERLQRFIRDESRLAKQRKDGQQDDKAARELLTMLPDAFTWRIESQTPATVTLRFEPRPEFRPPSLESRVLAAMNGSMVVEKIQHRIQTLSGKLTEDVTFGYGLFGRLKQGGTFLVERRQLAPKLWQITETHVHIDGKALLFKTIGQQQDEIQTDYTPVPNGATLQQALEMSRP